MTPARRPRQALQLRVPGPAESYGAFPARLFRKGTIWYRNHRDRPGSPDDGAWWFSCDGAGRFDLAPPAGTCYLAGTPEGAVLEFIGRDLASRRDVPADAFEGRVVSKVRQPHRVNAADVLDVRALTEHGVTGESSTTERYDRTQQWARTLATAGFDGIRYRLRFSPREQIGLALFAAAGGARPDYPCDADPRSALDVGASMDVRIVRPTGKSSYHVVDPSIDSGR